MHDGFILEVAEGEVGPGDRRNDIGTGEVCVQ